MGTNDLCIVLYILIMLLEIRMIFIYLCSYPSIKSVRSAWFSLLVCSLKQEGSPDSCLILPINQSMMINLSIWSHTSPTANQQVTLLSIGFLATSVLAHLNMELFK